jgi:hypothetical protein
MRKIYLAIFCALLFLSSCDFGFHRTVEGNGELKKVTRSVRKADRIKVSDAINVVLTKGETGVSVEADDNLIKYIQIKNEDGWLVIRTKDNYRLRSENDITVYVSTETLRALEVSGSSNVTSNDQWGYDGKFNLDVAGSGDISLNVQAATLDADISGSGNIALSGEAESMKLDIAGSGNFRGYGLKCTSVNISISGSGEAEVYAEDRLKVGIAGSGDVKYKGNATVSRSVAGSGSVEKVD